MTVSSRRTRSPRSAKGRKAGPAATARPEEKWREKSGSSATSATKTEATSPAGEKRHGAKTSGGRERQRESRAAAKPDVAARSDRGAEEVSRYEVQDTTEYVGTIVKVVPHKGFGFVDSDCGPGDVFLHFSDLAGEAPPPDASEIEVGTKVRFCVEKDPKSGKMRATTATLLLEDVTSAGCHEVVDGAFCTFGYPCTWYAEDYDEDEPQPEFSEVERENAVYDQKSLLSVFAALGAAAGLSRRPAALRGLYSLATPPGLPVPEPPALGHFMRSSWLPGVSLEVDGDAGDCDKKHCDDEGSEESPATRTPDEGDEACGDMQWWDSEGMEPTSPDGAEAEWWQQHLAAAAAGAPVDDGSDEATSATAAAAVAAAAAGWWGLEACNFASSANWWNFEAGCGMDWAEQEAPEAAEGSADAVAPTVGAYAFDAGAAEFVPGGASGDGDAPVAEADAAAAEEEAAPTEKDEKDEKDVAEELPADSAESDVRPALNPDAAAFVFNSAAVEFAPLPQAPEWCLGFGGFQWPVPGQEEASDFMVAGGQLTKDMDAKDEGEGAAPHSARTSTRSTDGEAGEDDSCSRSSGQDHV